MSVYGTQHLSHAQLLKFDLLALNVIWNAIDTNCHWKEMIPLLLIFPSGTKPLHRTQRSKFRSMLGTIHIENKLIRYHTLVGKLHIST
jgi:hypothetical protein